MILTISKDRIILYKIDNSDWCDLYFVLIKEFLLIVPGVSIVELRSNSKKKRVCKERFKLIGDNCR